ncbi:MAG TPA: insulinase family protein [Puia sp.]|nr:insulinase family protein [Puia sp.]
MYIRILALALVFFIINPCFDFGQDLNRPIPLDSAVHIGVLPNGFTYYIRRNTEPAKRVQLYLVNKVGSILEEEDQRGLAHFMEHMNFNGSTHFPGNKLVDYLQKSGVRFGADLNANTSFDETVYELPIPTDDTLIWQNGFRIMRDWAQDATLDSLEIEKERGVVLEEKRMRMGAAERMRSVYLPVLLNHSRYANREPIGLESVLKNFTPATLRRYHHDWYRPDLQALIVVGDVDVKATEWLIRSLFSDLRNPLNEKPRTHYEIPLTGTNHFITVTDKEQSKTTMQVMIKHPEPKLLTEADFLFGIERNLFNQLLSERFTELSQQTNPPFMGVGGGIHGFMEGIDMFALTVTAKKGELEKAFHTTWELIEKVKRFGFSETELDRAKTNFLSDWEFSLKEKSKTQSINFVNEYKAHFLNSAAIPGTDWKYTFIKDHIASITLSEINALAVTYIKDSNRDILILAPDAEKSGLPDSATVIGWIDSIGKEELQAYADQAVKAPLMPVKPVPGRIVDVKQVKDPTFTELQLSNGVTIICMRTDFDKDAVAFYGASAGGLSLYNTHELPSAMFAASMVGSFGVANFNPIELRKVLNGKHVAVKPFIDEGGQGIEGTSTTEDLETALQLAHLYFTSPRKDSTLFHNIIANIRGAISDRYSDPNNVFADTMTRVLSNYNPRSEPFSLEMLDRVKLDTVYQVYKDRFADASGLRFIFIGNFNMDSLRPLLETYLGSLPALHKNEQPIDWHVQLPPGQISKKVYKGKENKAGVQIVYSGDYHFSPINNMRIRALAEVLQIRLTQRLREEESKVYSISVKGDYDKAPRNRFSIAIAFSCDPKNVEFLVKQLDREIEKIQAEGALQDDLAKFKAETRRNHELQLKMNSYWLNYLNISWELNLPLDRYKNWNKILDGITTKDLKHAAREYLSGKNRIICTLLPEN